jgi:hypothetical protein
LPFFDVGSLVTDLETGEMGVKGLEENAGVGAVPGKGSFVALWLIV